MIDGKIVIQGAPQELKERSGLRGSIKVHVSIKSDELAMLLASLDDECIVVETDYGFKMICSNPMKTVPIIIEAMQSGGFTLDRIETIPPTLEDIFHSLVRGSNGGIVS